MDFLIQKDGRRCKEVCRSFLNGMLQSLQACGKETNQVLLKKCIDARFPVWYGNEYEGVTLLCAACLLNDLSAVEWLLKNNADIYLWSELGRFSHEHTEGLHKTVSPVGIAITTHNDVLFDLLMAHRTKVSSEPLVKTYSCYRSVTELACSVFNCHVVDYMLKETNVIRIYDTDDNEDDDTRKESFSKGLFIVVSKYFKMKSQEQEENAMRLVRMLLKRQEVDPFETFDGTDAVTYIVQNGIVDYFFEAVKFKRVQRELLDSRSLCSICVLFSDMLENSLNARGNEKSMIDWVFDQDYSFGFNVNNTNVANAMLKFVMDKRLRKSNEYKLSLLNKVLKSNGIEIQRRLHHFVDDDGYNILLTFVKEYKNFGKVVHDDVNRLEFCRNVLRMVIDNESFSGYYDTKKEVMSCLIKNSSMETLSKIEKEIALTLYFNGCDVENLSGIKFFDVLQQSYHSANRFKALAYNLEFAEIAFEAMARRRLFDFRLTFKLFLLHLCVNRWSSRRRITVPVEMIKCICSFV